MVISFFKTNVLGFEETEIKVDNLNSTILILKIEYAESIDLDSKLINKNVFRNLSELEVAGQINTINVDVFKVYICKNICWIILFHF